MAGARWARSDRIAAIGVLATIVAIAVSVVIPELRRSLGLEPETAAPAVSVSRQDSATTSGANSPAISGSNNTVIYGNDGSKTIHPLSPNGPSEKPETAVLGRLLSPLKGNNVKILVEGEQAVAIPDQYGRFSIIVHKKSIERAHFFVWVDGKQFCDDYEPLGGLVTLNCAQ